MSGSIRETVTIRKPTGPCIIAKSDFDPKTMQLWIDEEVPPPAEQSEPEPRRPGRRTKR